MYYVNIFRLVIGSPARHLLPRASRATDSLRPGTELTKSGLHPMVTQLIARLGTEA